MQIIWFLAILFVIHYIADFFVQAYTWKKQNNPIRTLIVHTLTYSTVVLLGLVVLSAFFPDFGITHNHLVEFFLANTGFHFVTDLITKRIGRILKEYNEITAYVNVVALDQCIHYITLIALVGWLLL